MVAKDCWGPCCGRCFLYCKPNLGMTRINAGKRIHRGRKRLQYILPPHPLHMFAYKLVIAGWKRQVKPLCAPWAAAHFGNAPKTKCVCRSGREIDQANPVRVPSLLMSRNENTFTSFWVIFKIQLQTASSGLLQRWKVQWCKMLWRQGRCRRRSHCCRFSCPCWCIRGLVPRVCCPDMYNRRHTPTAIS